MLDRREVARQRTAKWRQDNPERLKQQRRSYYERLKSEGRLDEYYGNTNREQNKLRSRMWRRMNQGQVNATLARRRATLLRATPSWAEYEQIIHIYNEARRLTEMTGIDHQVDHIVPLVSKVVCGLHCLNNLQILTADENNRKKCKFEET